MSAARTIAACLWLGGVAAAAQSIAEPGGRPLPGEYRIDDGAQRCGQCGHCD